MAQVVNLLVEDGGCQERRQECIASCLYCIKLQCLVYWYKTIYNVWCTGTKLSCTFNSETWHHPCGAGLDSAPLSRIRIKTKEETMARWLLLALALCALATVAGERAFNALALTRITTAVARPRGGFSLRPGSANIMGRWHRG